MADIIISLDASNDLNPVAGAFLSTEMLPVLNKIKEDERFSKVITSAFTFVELINKFSCIFKDTGISLQKLYALMRQPPEWLIIEPLNELTEISYCDVPTKVENENVSMDDAIHIATALQRNDTIVFLTTDHILRKLELPKLKFI
jgi:predicted nucleic acid-binding protein